MGDVEANSVLLQLRGNLDLLLRAQRYGKTGYIVSDVESGRVYWSDTLFEQRKVAPQPFFTLAEGMQFIHPDDLDGFLKLRVRAAEDGREFEHEMRIICGDGSIIWERGKSQPQFDAAGKFTGLLSVIEDITETKAAKAALSAQEATYRALFDSIGDAILFTLNGNFVDCNDAALEMFRGTREQLIGRTPEDLSPKLQPDGLPSHIKARDKITAALTGQRQTFEWRHKRLDGSEFDAEVVLSRVEGAAEPYFFGVVRDITERKAAERALQASHDKFAGAFVASADAMMVATIGDRPGAGVILDVNDTAERMLGRNRDALIGKQIGQAGLTSSAADLQDVRALLLAQTIVRDYRATLLRSDGEELEALINGALFMRGDESLAVLSIRDMTEANRSERRIRELNASLQESVGQLRAIADNLPVAISQQDADGRFTFVNRTMEKWFASRQSEMLGKTVPDLVSTEYMQAIGPARERRNMGEYRSEVTLPYPDGVNRTIDLIFVPDCNPDGQPQGFFTLASDISDRKATEVALKASLDKFAGAFNSSMDAMIVSKLGDFPGGGVIIEANEAAKNGFAQFGRLLSGATFGEILTWFPHEDFRRRLFRDGHVRDEPVRFELPSGRTAHLLVSAALFHLGDKPHSLTVLRDVTRERNDQQKIRELNTSLEESLGQLRAIADNIPVAISYQDADGRFRFTNRTMEAWFSSAPGGMLGKTVADLAGENYLAAIEPYRKKFDAGQSRMEATIPYPDGVTRSVEATIVHDSDADGAIRGRYALLIDLSERRAAEEQLRQSQKMQAIGKLTGGVAHDFNNLLGVISGNLELAGEVLGPDDGKIGRLLLQAQRAAERGSTLTRSLLSFARQQALSPQVVEVNTLVHDTIELLRRTLPSNIAIKSAGGAGLWKSEIDPGQLQNALLNLVVNARDAMPEGGRLTIETRNAHVDADDTAAHDDLMPGQYVMLTVSDTGSGMSPDVIARAFEPFFTTKEIGQGTGLGLSMVYGFAKQSGGHVSISSEVGTGTSVKLYLPRWLGSGEAEAVPSAREIPVANNETVLVVEDDEDMRFITVTMLRSLGYAVLEAASGPKALKIFGDHAEISLILTDVVLAGSMNGRRVAQEAQARRPGISVLYMSGYAEDAIIHGGRLDPGVRFIQKPFRKQDLANKVRAALDTVEMARPEEHRQ